MLIEVEVISEVIQFTQVEGLKDGIYTVEIKNLDTQTRQQQKSYWMWAQMIANVLNRENVPVSQLLKADVKWDREKVKYMFFNPVMEALFGIKTSTKMQKPDYDLFINTLTKAFGQRGITLPAFPSIEEKENG